MSNDGMTSMMESVHKKIDKMIEEDKTNNEITTDIINYLEELEKIQDNLSNNLIGYTSKQNTEILIKSKVLIAKVKETIKIMTSKNLFNKTTDSHDVTINYYCQDPTQYPTPNMENAHVEIVYHDKE